MKNFLITILMFTIISLSWCTDYSIPIDGTWNVNTGLTTTGIVVQTWTTPWTTITWSSTDKLSWIFTINLSDTKHDLSFLLNIWEEITIKIEQPSVKASVRVSQVVMPDGTMDGPFGSELKFIATQSWVHTFIISVNQMASEDIFTGSVIVNVTGTNILIKK